MDGWYSHVPVDNIDPDPNVIQQELEQWGGYLLPDLRIRAGGRSFATVDSCCLPELGSDNCIEQLGTMMGKASYPGFEPPLPGEDIALIVGESRRSPPWGWAMAAIDRYFDAGLRLFMLSYDIGDLELTRRFVFHSAPEDVHEMKLSKHCVGIEWDEDTIGTEAA